MESNSQQDKFCAFWDLYPRKIAKAAAQKAWKKLSAAEQMQAIGKLSLHLMLWRAKSTSVDFIPYPASWLNGKRFEDEIVIGSAAPLAFIAVCAKCGGPLATGYTDTSQGRLCNPCWGAR